MADISVLLPFILSWEGGFVCHPNDKGGATNKGVTIKTWMAVGYDKDGDGDIDVDDLRLLTDADVRDRVLGPHYWDRWRASELRSQSVANLVVDWVWASGAHGIKNVQRVVGVKQDGVVGPKTLAAVNNQDQRALFDRLMRERVAFVEAIVARDKTQACFRAGWLRRLAAIGYGWLLDNGSKLPRRFTP